MFGDGYLYYTVMTDPEIRAQLGIVILLLWTCFAIIALVVSCSCLYLKGRAYVIILHQRREEFDLGDGNGMDNYTAKHMRRLNDSRKSIQTTRANLLVGSLEDAPFGVFGLLYLFKMGGMAAGKSNFLQMLSVASSFLMLGVKVSKLPDLKRLMEYESKQKKKIARTSLESMQAIGVQKWFQQFPQLKEYSSRFAELTPDQMLKLKDGDLLETFNIENNVDRQYLLLQLARVQEHEQVDLCSQKSVHAKQIVEANVLLDEHVDSLACKESIEMVSMHGQSTRGLC
jgi:hypothetical protein